MRVTVIGVKRMSGVGKESGRSFDFAQVQVLMAMEQADSKNFQLRGYGYETSKLDLAIDALDKFRDVRFPCVLDLAIENVPGRLGMRTVVVGFRPTEAKAAA